MEYKNYVTTLDDDVAREKTKIENAYDHASDAKKKAKDAEIDLLKLEVESGQLEFKEITPKTELSKAAETFVRLNKAIAKARIQVVQAEQKILAEMHKEKHFAYQIPVDDMKFRFMLKPGNPKIKVEYADK